MRNRPAAAAHPPLAPDGTGAVHASGFEQAKRRECAQTGACLAYQLADGPSHPFGRRGGAEGTVGSVAPDPWIGLRDGERTWNCEDGKECASSKHGTTPRQRRKEARPE